MKLPCLANVVESVLRTMHRRDAIASDSGANAAFSACNFAPGSLEADISDALPHLDPDCPRSEWVKYGQACKGVGEHMKPLFEEFSRRSTRHNPENFHKEWASFDPHSITFRTILAEAQRRGWRNPAKAYWANVEILPAVAAFSKRFASRVTASPLPASALVLPLIDPAVWADVALPERRWLWTNWILAGLCT